MPRTLREDFEALRGRLAIDDEGLVHLDGTRTLIVPALLLTEIEKATRRILGHGAGAVLYRAGEQMGRRVAERALAISGRQLGRDELVVELVRGLEAAGFGSLEIVSLDLEKGEGVLRARQCAWIEERTGSEHPLCYFSAAFWAGMLGAVAGKELVPEERACLARGDPHCEYAAFPPTKSSSADLG